MENHDDDYKSYEAVSLLLKKYPDLDALYFTAAGVYGGCRAILNAALPKPPKVITFDAVSSTKEMLQKGIIHATICQNPTEQGACSLAVLTEYLLTGNVPEQNCIYMEPDIKIRESF